MLHSKELDVHVDRPDSQSDALAATASSGTVLGELLAAFAGGVGVVEGKFLKQGDVIKISIAELGYIENKVIDEPDTTVMV